MPFKTLFVLTLMASQLYLTGNCEPQLVTCDFDLLQIEPSIIDYLPIECKEAVDDDVLREKMRTESLRFNQFMVELNNKEGGVEDWEFRYKVYQDAELNLCATDSETSNDYIDCLTAKRDLMIDALRNGVEI